MDVCGGDTMGKRVPECCRRTRSPHTNTGLRLRAEVDGKRQKREEHSVIRLGGGAAAGLLAVSSRRPVEAPLLTRSSFRADRDIYVHLLSGAARHLESHSAFVRPPLSPGSDK